MLVVEAVRFGVLILAVGQEGLVVVVQVVMLLLELQEPRILVEAVAAVVTIHRILFTVAEQAALVS
jgi:hypothetical protein